MSADTPAPDKLSIVVFSGDFEKVHYALVMASAAAAVNTPVTLFFSMGACKVMSAPVDDGTPGWASSPVSSSSGMNATTGAQVDAMFKDRNIGTFDELLSACVQLGVTFMVCEMGLRAMNMQASDLRADVPFQSGGVVTFLDDASGTGSMIFI